MNRHTVVTQLIEFSGPIKSILEQLKKIPWDFDGIPITLSISHVINACNKLKLDLISETDLEDWANAIECREDISFYEEDEEALGRYIHELANPYLIGKTIHEIAKTILESESKNSCNR